MQKQYCVFIFILACAILKCSCTIDMVNYLMYNNTDNWHRIPEQILVIPKVSRVQCIGYCHKNVDCLSVNYNKQLLICELNDYYPQGALTTYVSESGWKVYYPKTFDPKKGATAWQSSTVAWGSADLALDGNTQSHFFGKSCTHTEAGDSWWAMEMKSEMLVTRIVVYLRSDSCTECPARNQNIHFLVSSTRQDVDNNIGTNCATYVGPPVNPSLPQTINCTGAITGKFLKVTQGSNLPLTLCEIYIY